MMTLLSLSRSTLYLPGLPVEQPDMQEEIRRQKFYAQSDAAGQLMCVYWYY